MSMKEDRAREGKKARYRKMGFGPAMDRGDIDFKDKHPLTKKRLKNFKKKDDSPMSDERFYQQRKAQINKAGVSTKKMLTGGQAKIAAKAPPPNKLDEKDFAVLRAEKAKGRGMGLQDEKVKDGKVQKAALGMLALGIMGKKYLDKKKSSSSAPLIGGAAEIMKKKKEILGKRMGGVMKYKRGSGLDLPVISSVKPTVNKTKRAQNLSKMKIQFNKQKSRMGKNPNTTTMAEMRKEKGFKPGESATDFNKRRKMLAGVTKAASATKIGKIVLPIAAAGVAAQQYLKSKMKKKDVKKKMGGGMMMQRPMGYKGGGMDTGRVGEMKSRIALAVDRIKKAKKSMGIGSGPISGGRLTDSDKEKIKSLIGKNKAARPIKRNMGGMMMQKPMGYTKGGGADMSGSRYKAFQITQDVLKTLKDIPTGQEKLQNTLKQAKNFVKQIKAKNRDKAKVQTKMGGGMMMQKPMGYRSGTMVKARGCKLGRNKPTKIT